MAFNETFQKSAGEIRKKFSEGSPRGKLHYNMKRLKREMKSKAQNAQRHPQLALLTQNELLSPINGAPFEKNRISETEISEKISRSEEYNLDVQKHFENFNPDPLQDTFGIRGRISNQVDNSNLQSSLNLPQSTRTYGRVDKPQKDKATQMSYKNLKQPVASLDDSLEYFKNKYKIDRRKIRKLVKNRRQREEESHKKGEEKVTAKPEKSTKKTIKKEPKKANNKINFTDVLVKSVKKGKKKLNFIDERTKSICEKYSQGGRSVDSQKSDQKETKFLRRSRRKLPSKQQISRRVRETPYSELPFDSKLTFEDKMNLKYSRNPRFAKMKQEFPKSEIKTGSRFSKTRKPTSNEVFECYYNKQNEVKKSVSPLRSRLVNFKSSFAAIDPDKAKHSTGAPHLKQSQRTNSSQSRTQITHKKESLRFGRGTQSWFMSPPHNADRIGSLLPKHSASPDPQCTPKKNRQKFGRKEKSQAVIGPNQMTPKSNQNSYRAHRSSFKNRFKLAGNQEEEGMRLTFKQSSPLSVSQKYKKFCPKENVKKNSLNTTSGGPWSVQQNSFMDLKSRNKKQRNSRPGTNELLGEYDLVVDKVIKASQIYKKKRLLDKQQRDFEKLKKKNMKLMNEIIQ